MLMGLVLDGVAVGHCTITIYLAHCPNIQQRSIAIAIAHIGMSRNLLRTMSTRYENNVNTEEYLIFCVFHCKDGFGNV